MLAARDVVNSGLRVARNRARLNPAIIIWVLTNLHRMPTRTHPGHVQRISERQQMVNFAPLKPAKVSRWGALETLSRFKGGNYPSESSRPEDFGKKSALTAGVSSHARLNA